MQITKMSHPCSGVTNGDHHSSPQVTISTRVHTGHYNVIKMTFRNVMKMTKMSKTSYLCSGVTNCNYHSSPQVIISTRVHIGQQNVIKMT